MARLLPPPYYRSDDDSIVVYNANCLDVLNAGLVPLDRVSLIHADPSYGVAERTNRKTNRRGAVPSKTKRVGSYAKAHDWPPLAGDDRPYDPAPILALRRPTVLWGANNYASRLPDVPGWMSWDKRDGTTSDDNGDVELAWTSFLTRTRRFPHAWRGLARASETGTPHLGPTQKPVALSAWVFQEAKLERGALVFVPYLGTGPDLPAAVAMGFWVIACDVSELWCRVAVSRLRTAPHPEPTEALGDLFARSISSGSRG